MATENPESGSPAASESAGIRRRLLQGALTLLILSLLAIGFWPDPIPVSVQEVADGPLAVTLREEGKTRFQERSLVSSPSAGWLSDIRAEGGDTVRAGDRLAVIRSAAGSIPDERQAEIAKARTEAARSVLAAALDRVDLARRQLAFQQRERDRTQELLDSGIGTRQALEAVDLALQQARTALDTAESEVERDRFEVRAAEAALFEPDPGASREQVIRSPADGVVLRVFDRRDRLVNTGEPILEVGEAGAIEVVADVRSSDAVSLRPGMAIRV
jgi:HlyD family secretion protein